MARMKKESISATEFDELRAFLESDELRHITPLKMLGLFGDALTVHRVDAMHDFGYILTMPRSMSQWASAKYPDAERLVYPALPSNASNTLLESVAQSVLRLTQGKTFLVNTIDTSLIERLQRVNDERLPLSLRVTLLTFIPPNDDTVHTRNADYPDESTRYFAHIPPEAQSLLATQNSYSERELATMFADGAARCWLRFVDETPVAVLLTFANSRTLHEIGSLHVRADARRAGHAQTLVHAALRDLHNREIKARYVVEASNAASIALAERCGLGLALRAEHWISRG
jgi:ribosomal protein S18 acetylase RimI-like enzyme